MSVTHSSPAQISHVSDYTLHFLGKYPFVIPTPGVPIAIGINVQLGAASAIKMLLRRGGSA
jgi:hypothetical protein